MNILVLGSGGREHALAWRLSQDAGVERVYVMPGNPGMTDGKLEPLLKTMSFSETREFCENQKIAFVMVGPEKFLFEGWVDQFEAAGIPAVGPTRRAAQLEESKAFSKSFMTENHIPTARFFNVKSESEALDAVERARDWTGIVVKLSGPALGKGVVVTESAAEARDVIKKFYAESAPGIEGGMVIEEKLTGKEVSLFYACLDREYRFIASAGDHKRLLDRDQGPNTGGMGAISPSPWIDGAFLARVEEKVVRPTLEGMAKAGTPYRGILFIGLMGESMLEYNVRFGDPETQAIMPLLTGNFAEFLLALGRGDVAAFKAASLRTGQACSIHIVKAAKGYPGLFGEKIESGVRIESSVTQVQPAEQWFYAGVKKEGNAVVTSGGRVLGLTVWGASPAEVQSRAYNSISQVRFAGEQFRKDIGGQR